MVADNDKPHIAAIISNLARSASSNRKGIYCVRDLLWVSFMPEV